MDTPSSAPAPAAAAARASGQVTVNAADLRFVLDRMALSGCQCSEGNEGRCVCDLANRPDHLLHWRLWCALPAELRD